jgi:hypothetical protein
MTTVQYSYMEKFDMNFELPEVATSESTRPKIHIGGDVCVSCEG